MNVITIFFFKKYIKKINELILNKNLNKRILGSFPNYYILGFTTIACILFNIEGLITNRFDTFQYYELLGEIANIIYQIEILQYTPALPIIFSAYGFIILTALKLKKKQERYHVSRLVLHKFLKQSLFAFQIYLIFFTIYFILICLNITSQSITLTIFIVITYSSVLIAGLYAVKTSLLNIINLENEKNITGDVRESIISDVYVICNRFKKINRKKENWENFIEILKNRIKFNEYFYKLFEKNNKFENFNSYYRENSSKKKIIILLYILGSFEIKNEVCFPKEILDELKFPKSTTYKIINSLISEGFIKRKKIENLTDKALIPFNQ